MSPVSRHAAPGAVALTLARRKNAQELADILLAAGAGP
jgi:hypothetical protein